MVQSLGHGSVPLSGGVLVAEGGLGAGVAEAVHELLGAGAGAGGEGASQVAEVVEVDVVGVVGGSCS